MFLSQRRIYLSLLASECRREQHIRTGADMSSGGDLNNNRGSSLYHYHGRSRISVILGSLTIYDNYQYGIDDICLYRRFFRSLGSLVCDSRRQSRFKSIIVEADVGVLFHG